jgi:hypothetical protein
MSESQLHGIEKFIAAVMEETRPIIEEIVSIESALEVMGNVIFDEPGVRHMGLTPSPKEKLLQKILSGLSEIEDAFQVLNDIPFYIKHFPPKNSKVSKTRFLNYHIGNYLNENYILRERLVTYQKVVTRMYKSDRRLVEMGKHVKRLELLVSGFDGIVATRGKHVHQERYDDEDFARLDIYERMSKEEDTLASVLGKLYPLALRDYRKKWIRTISDNNNKIKEILDMYFEILYDVVFDKNGKWIDPSKFS